MIKANNKNDLIKLIQENPDLPFVFMVSNNEIASDYSSTVYENFRAYKSEIYKYEQWGDIVWTDDRYDVFEYYANELCDEDGYKDLFNEDFDKAIDKYINENIEHYEAIVVYVS